MANEGIICQGCGIEAPVKYVEFYQNIGMLVMRQHRFIKGNLCKKCVHANFWKLTSVTVAVGWLGTISVIIAPIFVLNNLARYLMALGMSPVPAGASIPQLTQEVAEKIGRQSQMLISRLNNNEPANDVARDIANRTGVTPGQVLLYVRFLAQQAAAARQQESSKTYGFPVMPAAPTTAVPPPIPVRPIS